MASLLGDQICSCLSQIYLELPYLSRHIVLLRLTSLYHRLFAVERPRCFQRSRIPSWRILSCPALLTGMPARSDAAALARRGGEHRGISHKTHPPCARDVQSLGEHTPSLPSAGSSA